MKRINRASAWDWTLLALGAASLMAPVAASAQSAAGPPETPVPDEDIVVTGSRIARSAFQTATPVTAVSQDQLEAKAASSAVDLLRDIPVVRPNRNSFGSANVGISTFDLRALGSSRTLLLIDSKRVLDSSPTGGFDINILPSQLIKRIEVVTAGASSVYGSNAITGVVNIFLDSKHEGGTIDAQYGISDKGDYRNYSLSGIYGTKFAGDRGHIVVAASYFNRPDILYQGARNWGSTGSTLLTNNAYTATNGQYRLLVVPNARLSRLTEGGLITSAGPLQNIQFGAGGTQSLFVPGTNVGSVYMIGGSGLLTQPDYGAIAPSQRRVNAFASASFDISPSVEAFGEILFARTQSTLTNTPNYNNGDIVVKRDNAFLPVNILQIMVNNGTQSFTLGRLNLEQGVNTNTVQNTYIRSVGGLKGKLGGWSWDASVLYTHALNYSYTANNRITANWNLALDSVIGPAGTPICRSTLTNPSNGCVPANIFGIGTLSPAVVAYTTGTSYYKAFQDGVDAAVNARGNLFSTWAGPIGAAIGAEYRRETVNLLSDPISAASGWRQRASAPYYGQINVKEAYAELSIPLARDTRFFKDLELDVAGRGVDYSTSGSAFVWKAGLNWAVDDQLRFRGTYSRDFRAPRIDELFSAAVAGSGTTAIDRSNNTTILVASVTGGNPNLRPEKGRTYTFGAVVQPHFLPRFQLSVDYYNISLTDALSSFSVQSVIDRCYNGDQTFCTGIIRDPTTNVITKVISTNYNAAFLKTSGVDIVASYRLPMSSFSSAWTGDLLFDAQASYVAHLINNNNGVSYDLAGQLTSTIVGIGGGATSPHWRGTGSITYNNGPLVLRLLGSYIGAGKFDNTFGQFDIERNNFPAFFYLDASAQYSVTKNFQLYAKLDNLFDTDPPLIADNTIIRAQASFNAATSMYDQVGRAFTMGFRVKF